MHPSLSEPHPTISSRSSRGRSRGRRFNDPEVVKHAGDLAALGIYFGLGQLRGRRPGRVSRLTRSLVVRRQIQEAFSREKKSSGRGRLVVAGGGAIAGFALARAWRKRKRRPTEPPVEPVREESLESAIA